MLYLNFRAEAISESQLEAEADHFQCMSFATLLIAKMGQGNTHSFAFKINSCDDLSCVLRWGVSWGTLGPPSLRGLCLWRVDGDWSMTHTSRAWEAYHKSISRVTCMWNLVHCISLPAGKPWLTSHWHCAEHEGKKKHPHWLKKQVLSLLLSCLQRASYILQRAFSKSGVELQSRRKTICKLSTGLRRSLVGNRAEQQSFLQKKQTWNLAALRFGGGGLQRWMEALALEVEQWCRRELQLQQVRFEAFHIVKCSECKQPPGTNEPKAKQTKKTSTSSGLGLMA